MRVLVLGAGGLLGRDVCAEAPGEVVVASRTHATLDVTDADAVSAVLRAVRPGWVMNCAAWTDVDAAESHEAAAYAVNAVAPAVIGAAAVRAGARVAHVSTDHVFDGAATKAYTEQDSPTPVNAYGRSKLAGERALAAADPRALVLRTQWTYGTSRPNFVRTMREGAATGTPARVVADQWGAPNWSREVARALWRLVGCDAAGVVHYSASGVATRSDVARAVYAHAGRDALVTPCTTGEFPRPARRPARAMLDTAHYTALTGDRPRAWREPLTEFLSTPASSA